MADVLHVGNEGLQLFAAHCAMVSAELVAATPLPGVGLPVRATSGVVGAAHADLDKAITVLSERAQASTAKAALPSAHFALTDASGAQQVAAISASISQV
ncbi:hypothetical protein [Mycobacterium numidiamassiliense]|uniref:hypothetical protein n=1 Tax=Mycobacterium numidiamassiliense TaxID=1841861 RepID=UPI00097D34AE|nr:hypothetical protein [Mycobacterium numidiamassiliense]